MNRNNRSDMDINTNGASVTINNRTYSGDNIVIRNGVVIVDGNTQDQELTKIVNVTVNGNCGDVTTVSGEINISGSARNATSTSGNVTCGNVEGDAKSTSGNIRCGHVGGNVKTVSGDIRRS